MQTADNQGPTPKLSALHPPALSFKEGSGWLKWGLLLFNCSASMTETKVK